MSDRLLKLALLVAGLSVLGYQVWAKPRPSAAEIHQFARGFLDPEAWRERVAPDFELTQLDGSTFRLADRIGEHIIVLNFFATWCGPCRAEMPELERYYQTQAGSGVILLGIDAEEKHVAVESFVKELKLTFPIVIDDAGDVMRLYDVSSFPTTVVIGVDGRVKLYETGAISNADVALGPVVAPQVAALREGRGIGLEEYRRALADQPRAEGAAAPLEGRARHIAEAMPCPCGCTDKVMACKCATSKAIKARLAKGGYDGKTDVEVMQELNREFCMKGM